MTSPPTLLTTEEVAEILRVDPETVRRYARDKRLPAFALPGGLWRFHRRDVDEFMSTEPTGAAS